MTAQSVTQGSIAAANRHKIGVNCIAGRIFEQKKCRQQNYDQHRYRAEQPALDYACGTAHWSVHKAVSAQLETAQRGLLATFSTLSRATVMKPHSATLMGGRSRVTSF